MGEGLYVLVVIIGIVALAIAPVLIVLWWRHQAIQRVSQQGLSDIEILQIFHRQPDRILSIRDLSRETGLSKSDLRAKLSQFQFNGILQAYTTGTRTYYELKKSLPLEGKAIFSEAYLHLEDIYQIFHLCDFQVSLADVISLTGFSLKAAKAELKEFVRDGVLSRISNRLGTRIYVLNEPHKSAALESSMENTPAENEGTLDLDLLALALAHQGEISKQILLDSKKYSSQEIENILIQLERSKGFEPVEKNQELVFRVIKSH